MYEDEIPVGRAKDLRGQHIDNCTVLYRVKSNIGNVRWKCKCDCGNIFYSYANNLLNKKYTHSCGCKSKKGLNLLNGDGYQGKNKINLLGQVFGLLTVIEETDKRTNQGHGGQIIWKCKCKCGNITYASGYDLRSGHIISCGCLNQSHGEFKIETILKDNNIFYEHEYHDHNCIFKDTLKKASFDFAIFNKNNKSLEYLIEYDGDIHYEENIRNNGWNTEELFLKRKFRDKYKNEWCKINNIPLIRIPYTHLDNLTIEDLKLETSKFLI